MKKIKNKSVFLNGVSGTDIVNRQGLINETQGSKVVATTILPRLGDTGKPMMIEDHYGLVLQLYDAWIYFTEIVDNDTVAE